MVFGGAAFRRWIGTRSLYGQTGSAGAQTANEPNGAAYGRFHGVLAPNSRYRESVTPLSIRKVKPVTADVEADGLEEPNPRAGKRKGLCCTLKGINTEGRPAKRLKRVFDIKVSVGRASGGLMKIIATIEDPMVIGKILSHLEARRCTPLAGSAKRVPAARAPPPGVC